MKHPFRAALGRPIPNAIYATDSLRLGETEAGIESEQRGDGRSVRSARRTAVEKIYRRGNPAGHQSASVVLRDGAIGARLRDDGADSESDACSRRDDRTQPGVIPPVNAPAFVAKDLVQITREALRAAALAPTVYDALDVTGEALRRLAELAHADSALHYRQARSHGDFLRDRTIEDSSGEANERNH